MQAQLAQEGDIVIVHLSGHVDVETAVPFRQACLQRLAGKKVVFDFRQLSFVGSSGILPFLETMQEFADANPHRFVLSGVGIEFKKVFAATSLCTIPIFETSAHAACAYSNPNFAVVQAAPMVSATETESPAETTAQTSDASGWLNFREVPKDAPQTTGEDFDENSEG